MSLSRTGNWDAYFSQRARSFTGCATISISTRIRQGRHEEVCMRGAAMVVGLAAVLAVSGQAADKRKDPSQIGKRDVGKGVNFYSPEKEIALGRQLAQEVVRQAKLSEDPILTEYVNRMGQNLVRNSDAKYPFTFQVIESD